MGASPRKRSVALCDKCGQGLSKIKPQIENRRQTVCESVQVLDVDHPQLQPGSQKRDPGIRFTLTGEPASVVAFGQRFHAAGANSSR